MRSASPSDAAPPAHVNILIAGAGVMGAATAFWLTSRDPSLRVLLVEREPDFARASSSLSASSIRQQFTTPVNIALSAFGIQFLRDADRALALEGTAPGTLSLGLTEPGYLYLAAPEHESVLRTANVIQRAAGADVALLSPADLGERFPWLATDGIALGSLGLSGEGWFDGPALHQALLARARAQGARLIADTVCGINLSDRARSGTKRVTRVQLASGAHIQCDHFVNAAGPWSRTLAALAGIALPVAARRRTVFVLSCPLQLPACPLLIDPSGFWLRPEGRYLITGSPPIDDTDDLPLEPDWRELDEARWAQLAHRIPALEAMRIERAWAGYYEMNLFDHNAVIGPPPDVATFWMMSGFSGHGMQHAPGAGLALSEWLLDGLPSTIDVRPLSYERIARGERLPELNVIG
jgi:glycine/D-amino acid oxidase-like deaminating enzyme